MKASWSRRKFQDWPDDAVNLPTDEIVKLYGNGFIGAQYNPEAWEEFKALHPAAEDICHYHGLAESGAGKLSAPFVYVLEQYPTAWPGAVGQGTGDCTKADAIVRMADGTTKRIADVQIGEMVVSAKNKARRVEAIIRKPFAGQMVRVRVHGYDNPLELTPDHLVVVCEKGADYWVPIDKVKIGEHLLLPRNDPEDDIIAKVVSIERFDWSDDVHCLVVEEDHSFIADGYAVHNCVSWGQRSSMLGTMVTDVIAGIPDPKTGKVEGFPEVSAEGASHGVLSTEVLYAYRGHSGQGWYCPGAAKIVTSTCGMVLRQNQPDIGMDLTTYNVRNATKYGGSPPPESFAKLGGQRLVHEATSASSAEAVRDLIANGYMMNGCGGEGFSETRDENGVSKRSGSWAHSMAQIGFDDRPVVHRIYGGPLLLILNSWAKWNRGPRDIIESAALVPANKKQAWIDKGIVNAATGNIMIPEGSFWAKWSDVSRREHIAMSGVNGWPRKELTWEEVFI